MMKDKILIIANGPSILENLFGEEIDKFDEIGRINNYKINNFKQYVGQKTTIWFNGGNQNLVVPKKISKKIVVLIPYEIINNNIEKIIKRTSNRLGLNTNQYELISEEKMKYYEKISKIKRPTTGFNSILWAVENYKKVIIHGFDFFQKSKEHYYDSYILKKISNLKIMQKAKKHDNLSEKLFVEKLLLDKKVIKLTDYIKNNKN